MQIGHYRLPLCLCFKASLSAKPFLRKWLWFAWKWSCMQNSFHMKGFALIDSSNRGTRELGNGLKIKTGKCQVKSSNLTRQGMNEKLVSITRQERERGLRSSEVYQLKGRSNERKPSKPKDVTAWMHSLHYTGRTTAIFCHWTQSLSYFPRSNQHRYISFHCCLKRVGYNGRENKIPNESHQV